MPVQLKKPKVFKLQVDNVGSVTHTIKAAYQVSDRSTHWGPLSLNLGLQVLASTDFRVSVCVSAVPT